MSRSPPFGPFEDTVLNKVRATFLARLLVARTNIDIDSGMDHRTFVPLKDNADAVIQYMIVVQGTNGLITFSILSFSMLEGLPEGREHMFSPFTFHNSLFTNSKFTLHRKISGKKAKEKGGKDRSRQGLKGIFGQKRK